MTNMQWLIPGFVAAITLVACDSKDNLLSVKDGAVDTRNGTGGGLGGTGVGGAAGRGGATGNGGATTVGTGGAPSGGISGSGGIVGSGGVTATGVGGRGGASTGGSGGGVGGIGGTGGPGSGGSGGSGGSPKQDGGVADAARDVPSGGDATDGIVECEPGYPVGSQKPMGDGCNTCYCQASGTFLCTTKSCLADAGLDAATDGAQCPSGQMWCPGCPPDPGFCAGVCPAAPCAAPDGGAVDTGVPACSALTTESDCRARSDCHPLFYDPANCRCATLGCCAAFSRCADGKADCEVPTQFSCTIAQPYCEGPYVLAYRAGCYEGCVLSTDCSGLSSCSPAPSCGVGEIPVRVQRPDLGEMQCTCEPNPCPSSFPTCDCAAELCTKYPGVSCVGYMPDSGQLVCTEQG